MELWIEEVHPLRQPGVVEALEQKLGRLHSDREVAVVDRCKRKVTYPGEVGVVVAHDGKVGGDIEVEVIGGRQGSDCSDVIEREDRRRSIGTRENSP